MRKTILVVVSMLAFYSMAYANQMNTGCGLGTMLLGDSGDTKLMQILITSTNATSTNQSTGITFDIQSFGCAPTRNWASEDVIQFVQGNIDSLARDVAAGSGETITTLASLMEIEDVDGFGGKLQDNFTLIFPSEDVEYAHVVDAIYLVSNS